MKHIIIGTAGHIDHGKTTLIKALTGRETDTLKEEKERGISINLGFTFFDLPSGKRAGIIDVPGHEKFIKNALAGVSSIDLVLLVIAADEGIMPQTKEHFEILQLLNVKKGIIVLTKADLVENEWLSMVKEEIKDYFKGTFLENASIHSVSSKTGSGLKGLIEDIDKLTEEVEVKDTEGHFRLTVDRVFSVSGFGTVVTGTIISGRIYEGETVQIYPSNIISKVRGIQVHEDSVKFAEAGQRCAINLSNIKVEEIKRGDVIAKQNTMVSSLMVDCSLHYLKSCKKPLKNRQRVKLYHGTSEILCRVILLDRDELVPGNTAYVQLRLEEFITAQRNDRFVIRNYSPMYTMGGGTIIEPSPRKAKSFDYVYLEELKIKESGSAESILERTVEKLSSEFPDESFILKALGKNEENLKEKLDSLAADKRIIRFKALDKEVYIHKNFLKNKIQDIEKFLEKFHRENPLKIGVSKEEFKNKIFGKNIKQKVYDEFLELLIYRNIVDLHGNYVSRYGFEIKYTKDQIRIKNKIIDEYIKRKYLPPKYEELCESERDKKIFKMVYDSLFDSGELFKVSEDVVVLNIYYEEAKKKVINYINKYGRISAAEARDMLNTSRKYAVALLVHFDNIKLTKRVEDSRVLYKK
ncbi:selenocysteine-specific translation elongation factor [Clostridium sp. SYSU_GA19001]|uniref:selenocysteine-specific translation elongation factor n=1 Tax=Clostridium caldaquaticum TaxID=2940653 RepID=UPI00207712F3|nr:selenocysteine-specific translation elongation factor [Clostridium caldaquaticum]MCM8710391.1 selenocysteine-specific translation elongation factor [Clostridium caldaquaticum]